MTDVQVLLMFLFLDSKMAKQQLQKWELKFVTELEPLEGASPAVGSCLDLCGKEFTRHDDNFLQESKGAWNQYGDSSRQTSVLCCDRWRVRNIKTWVGLEKIGSSTRRPSGFLEADNAIPSSAEDGLRLRVSPLQRSPT